MNWIDAALADVCGRPAERAGEWRLPSGDTLAVEHTDRELLVYAMRDAPHATPARWEAALRRCHLRRAGSLPVQAGIHGDGAQCRIVALTRIADREATPPELQRAVGALERWLDDWQTGA